MPKTWPLISIITPTLNAGGVLETELKSIAKQNYPQERIEIILADGGSTDSTLEIAKKYGAKVYSNPLKTAEAGKAVAVKKAKGKYIALIDSDNILPDNNWLIDMISPLEENNDLVGSEPWAFTYRKNAGYIERYSSLIGANDPIVLWYKNYDRLNVVSGKWTESDIRKKDKGNWIEVILERGKTIPTIGANGTIFKAKFLQDAKIDDYLFDIDILMNQVQKLGKVKFAKIKTGIIHTYCESDIKKFARKQKRRILDYHYYKSIGLRNTKWESKGTKKVIIKFALDTIFIIPNLIYAIHGFFKKPDIAWFIHPIACFITLYQYIIGTVLFKVKKVTLNRDGWKQ